MKKETVLEKIDSFLLSKKPSERNIIYGSIFLIFFALSFQYLFPITKKMVKKSKSIKQNIESNIRDDKDYIASVTINNDKEFLIKQLKRAIKKLKANFRNIKDKNDYIDFQIHNLSTLLYNEKNWAKFLDSIAGKAEKNGVNIDFISNEFVNNSKNFGHVLEIEIGCNGNFKNIIAFINSLEQSDLVVDLYDMELKSGYNIKADLKVSVWGINY